ncbi:hypothetical protein [Prevotella intermedia]|uniref:hypothetical protein n=1 Tax=Prevotella intermedia TaxID=28131 RepID=UPI000BE6FA40|nr:hypothetical protein [Prevotella intermedia]PDP82796.1 hypothetical protein CLI69_04135 [Prevotella intermedia]
MGDNNQMKTCPYCGNSIRYVAKKCRFCGEWLDEEQRSIHQKPVPKLAGNVVSGEAKELEETSKQGINQTNKETEEHVKHSRKNVNGLLGTRKLIGCFGVGFLVVVIFAIIGGLSGETSTPKKEIDESLYTDSSTVLAEAEQMLSDATTETTVEDNGFEDVEAKIELHVMYKDIFAHLEEEDRLIKKYFTNDFQEIWQRVKRYDAVNHKGEIGCIDYNIFTQDQDPNSKDYIEVQNVALSKDEKGKLKATAKVEIIDPASPLHTEVDIILMKKGSKWRIDDIVSINGGSLKSTMKNYLINDPNY